MDIVSRHLSPRGGKEWERGYRPASHTKRSLTMRTTQCFPHNQKGFQNAPADTQYYEPDLGWQGRVEAAPNPVVNEIIAQRQRQEHRHRRKLANSRIWSYSAHRIGLRRGMLLRIRLPILHELSHIPTSEDYPAGGHQE